MVITELLQQIKFIRYPAGAAGLHLALPAAQLLLPAGAGATVRVRGGGGSLQTGQTPLASIYIFREYIPGFQSRKYQ